MHGLLGLSHLLGISIYFGATVFLAIAIETVGKNAPDAARRRGRYAELFRIYDPLTIAALGVVVVTGAMMVTGYKETLGAGYFVQLGRPLAVKLAFAFFLIILSTWVSFGICHRVVNADLGATPVTDAALNSLIKRLRVALWLTMATGVATLWAALNVGAPVLVSAG
jgi:uncharacterized membrane protein